MKTKSEHDVERLARAQEIAAQVKAGTYIDFRANMQESWYPIRPKIKKNLEDMKRLYNADFKDKKD